MTNKGMLSVAEVAQLLEDMGDAEGVAFLLDMFDVRGAHHLEAADYGCRCPIARLTREATGRTAAWVTTVAILPGKGRAARHSVPLPFPARAFIWEYDHGEWPELEEAS